MTDTEVRNTHAAAVAAALRLQAAEMPRFGAEQIARADRALMVAELHEKSIAR